MCFVRLPRRNGYVHRLEGRLFSCAYCASSQAVSSFCLFRKSLSVQGASIWTLPTGVHQVHCGSPLAPAGTGHEDSAVPRRRLICAPSQNHSTRDTALLLSHVAWLGIKVNLEKRFEPLPELKLHWCGSGHSHYEGLSISRAHGQHPLPSSPLPREQGIALHFLPPPFGKLTAA